MRATECAALIPLVCARLHARTTPLSCSAAHGLALGLAQACIDQSNIAASLPCLPIFLSGCKELLVIAGETYTSRLWCVIELFTFLKVARIYT